MLRPDVPISPERWGAVMALLESALERPVAERAAFVDAAAGEDSELRAEVISLLAAESEATGFLASPAAVPDGAAVAANLRAAFGLAVVSDDAGQEVAGR